MRLRLKTAITTAGLGLVVLATVHAADPASLRSAAPVDARVYFILPNDGATLPPTFSVVFGLENMGVAPAGIDIPNTGHHHLLIDPPDSLTLETPLPANEHVLHFGRGETQTEVTLPPGTYKLQLLLANYLHIPHDPPVRSQTIEVTVLDQE